MAAPLSISFRLRKEDVRERNDYYVLQQLTSLFEYDGVVEVYGVRQADCWAQSRVLLCVMADGNECCALGLVGSEDF